MRGGISAQINVGYTDQDLQDLAALGFDEGDIEMIDDYYNIHNMNELIAIYLLVSSEPPYNLNWSTIEMAVNSPYELGIYKNNGIEYNKHDISQSVINFLEDRRQNDLRGGRYRNKKRVLKTRKNVLKQKGKRRGRKYSRRKYYSRKHYSRKH